MDSKTRGILILALVLLVLQYPVENAYSGIIHYSVSAWIWVNIAIYSLVAPIILALTFKINNTDSDILNDVHKQVKGRIESGKKTYADHKLDKLHTLASIVLVTGIAHSLWILGFTLTSSAFVISYLLFLISIISFKKRVIGGGLL